MLRFWDKVIKPLLVKFEPEHVIEIGLYLNGRTTIKLLEYCKVFERKLTVIDPIPVFDTEAYLAVFEEELELKQKSSLDALPEAKAADMVLIDGDHNWFTVFHELLSIDKHAQTAGKFPIVILHDTEWPYGRRDSYAFPEAIAQQFLKPHAKKGIIADCSELAESGGINLDQNNALFENGEQNGVLTAVEDFMKVSAFPLRLYRLYSNNGLGILASTDEKNDALIQYIMDTSGL
ncbi:class I SAM-dependent methyltransferase [Paenibacillus sp. y28]|uniref:class I SAM-dependent methyltransferase n=1 Tax=Paenibacillus sp. y28 TaxID=3129110 RepID=UPI00301660C5